MNLGQRVKLTGDISNLKRERGSAGFVLTDRDQYAMGAVALAAGVAGLGGLAISTTSAAASVEEDADYLEFDVAEDHVVGWVWRSPFQEGDRVEVTTIWDGERHQLQAMFRPQDGVTALYPHCSRGARAHVKNAFKWWTLLCFAISGISGLIGGWIVWDEFAQYLPYFALVAGGTNAFFGLMVISLARKWMPFVRVAESAFCTMGWPNPESIDLVKSSKRLRKGDEPPEYGSFYFRYKPPVGRADEGT